MTLAGRHVVLGVSGGIACYKACTLARRLTEAGASVDVVLTAGAAEFVRPVTFEALTGRPVLSSLWDRNAALSHIRLGQDADLMVVAPATANLLAKAAGGIADDLLTAALLAAKVPILVAPAMNDRMYANPATQENLSRLESRGWFTVGPGVGALAEGPSDRPGRMSEPEEIAAVAERLMRRSNSAFEAKTILVTAGPTRERIDPVRVLTNRSSGRMGYEIALAAYARGADVHLVTGPTNLEAPYGVTLTQIESTDEMRSAVLQALPQADVLIMAAAPADFAPQEFSSSKRPRGEDGLTLALEPTRDILESTRTARKPNAVVVGFALETGDGLERARDKMRRKSLDLIVLNHADEPGAGAEVETNRVTLLRGDDAKQLPLLPKRDVAEKILDAVEQIL